MTRVCEAPLRVEVRPTNPGFTHPCIAIPMPVRRRRAASGSWPSIWSTGSRSLSEPAVENGISLRYAYRWLARYRSGRPALLEEIGEHSLVVVVLAGTQGFLVGTGAIRRHSFGRIPLSGVHRLGALTIHDQGMAVVHEHMAPITRKSRLSVGLARQ